MNVRYMVRHYGDTIHELEVGKETDKCLWFTSMRNVERSNESKTHRAPGSRILKSSAYHETFATIEEAVQHIRQRYANLIERAEESVTRYKEQSTAFDKAAIVLIGEAPVKKAS